MMLASTTVVVGLRVRASVLREKLRSIWEDESAPGSSAPTPPANAARSGLHKNGIRLV